MGLDVNGTRFLLYARHLGADFSRTLRIGRQNLVLSASELKANATKFGMHLDGETARRIIGKGNGYADEFLRWIGAETVHSLDNSTYEGATHVCDLNTPIAEGMKGQYSVVLDGGSLEHVFNFPQAIKNCLEMVRVGGHFLAISPTNNFMGHGFYQFSPELFFSVLSPDNGYELVGMMALEDRPRSQWYTVMAPTAVKSRVTLINKRPTHLLVIAKRVRAISPFESMPQQSDYVSVWSEGLRGRHPLGAGLKRFVPGWIRRALRSRPGFNRRHYRRMEPRG